MGYDLCGWCYLMLVWLDMWGEFEVLLECGRKLVV